MLETTSYYSGRSDTRAVATTVSDLDETDREEHSVTADEYDPIQGRIKEANFSHSFSEKKKKLQFNLFWLQPMLHALNLRGGEFSNANLVS